MKSKDYVRPKNFPLSAHKRGWCKKINGKVVIVCGHVPPDEARDIYYSKATKLHTPRLKVEEPAPIIPPLVVAPNPPPKICMTVGELKTIFVDHKRKQLEVNAITERTYQSTVECVNPFAAKISGPIDELTPEIFGAYRQQLAERYKPNTWDRQITQVRAMFNWAWRITRSSRCLNGVIPSRSRR